MDVQDQLILASLIDTQKMVTLPLFINSYKTILFANKNNQIIYNRNLTLNYGHIIAIKLHFNESQIYIQLQRQVSKYAKLYCINYQKIKIQHQKLFNILIYLFK
ncbi:hypothetical protein TTHERM_000393228 (macronuclear) [Tetrahymena thermophila SB210]|uniref:Uncharacterized protein n=1 Tax=Tetrahymena thermophila (strain SB210) TaxID=312017 RepID=W7XJF9_TETTS|nr:hypothetical protein TTHERM_000393228 [Tetrahymena thermophila SB210]EWS75486.1 hypothetical protein TTHERM_000393228 [Tetrahymena thermophila SB210]|eukprot:XP_012651955.1 hypothetical protein TTHERM_000393228 [Tetrahymena thermophila SB210]